MAKFSIEILGGQITRLREAKSLSQDELAKQVGTSRQTINSWEGREMVRVTEPVANRLAHSLGVTIAVLTSKDVSSKEVQKSGGTGFVPEHVLEHYRNTAEHIMNENRRLWERLDRLEGTKGTKAKQTK